MKKTQNQGDQGELAKNPPIIKLVFSLKLRNSNLRSGEILLWIDMAESFYSEFWSGYLFGNFSNVGGS